MDLSKAQKQLAGSLEARYGKREAGLIADWVMERLTGLGKLDRLVQKNEALTAGILAGYERYAGELAAGRPVQYVLGESWFCGMKFYVDERVLIPRPETEELVEWVVADTALATEVGSRAAGGKAVLLDVGTGSGCMAIALARRGSVVYACDVSPEALEVAERNAAALEVSVGFCQLDFLDEATWGKLPEVSWVVSNPPYIPYRERVGMAGHVIDNEPALALFVPDEDVLVFYRALGKFAGARKATLFAEIHEDLGAAVRELLLSGGAREVIVRKDLQGKDRMIKATW